MRDIKFKIRKKIQWQSRKTPHLDDETKGARLRAMQKKEVKTDSR